MDQPARLCVCACVHTQSCLTLQPHGPACQAPLSMGFLRQGYWSGLPFPAPGDLPDPGIEPRSPTLEEDTLTSEPPGKILGSSSVSPSVVSDSFMTPWTVADQASLSMEFSRQESWSGLPFPAPGDLPDPGIEPRSPTLEVDSLLSEPPGKP